MTETAYLPALLSPPEPCNVVVHSHWGVENCRLDVVMNEDRDRTRLDNDAPNLAVLRPMAPNVHAGGHDERILRGKFTGAGRDDRYGPVACLF
jgi:predicted transposase YbfD/YdcC